MLNAVMPSVMVPQKEYMTGIKMSHLKKIMRNILCIKINKHDNQHSDIYHNGRVLSC
jgi:hypothetical protein